MIFMGLVLKIPVVAAAWLIWHAIRSEPEPAEAEDDGGGNQRAGHDHFRREPKRPRGPRRGPHAPGALPIPCAESQEGLRVIRRRPTEPIAAGSPDEHRR